MVEQLQLRRKIKVTCSTEDEKEQQEDEKLNLKEDDVKITICTSLNPAESLVQQDIFQLDERFSWYDSETQGSAMTERLTTEPRTQLPAPSRNCSKKLAFHIYHGLQFVPP